MDISETIINYIKNPTPLWNEEVVNIIVNYKWDTLLKDTFHDQNNYTIAGCIFNDETQKEETCTLPDSNTKIQVVFPSNNLLSFYNKHGLTPVSIDNSLAEKLEKIKRAMSVLGNVTPLHSCILQLVKSMQIIASANSETDISYSHPDIPFSIFFSICEDNSIISNLRVSESILHESMHLMLTLIENQFDLIVPNSRETYYSPWREEQRSVRGVLHGEFVFKAIKDFYILLFNSFQKSSQEYDFIRFRVLEIENEFSFLKKFPQSPGLTELGRILSYNLLNN